MAEFEFKSGEYWEGMPWKLIIPYESSSMNPEEVCRHAVLIGEPRPQTRSDGSIWGYKQAFVLTLGIVQCKNEAGHNGTGLCLECLDEARATVGKSGE